MYQSLVNSACVPIRPPFPLLSLVLRFPLSGPAGDRPFYHQHLYKQILFIKSSHFLDPRFSCRDSPCRPPSGDGQTPGGPVTSPSLSASLVTQRDEHISHPLGLSKQSGLRKRPARDKRSADTAMTIFVVVEPEEMGTKKIAECFAGSCLFAAGHLGSPSFRRPGRPGDAQHLPRTLSWKCLVFSPTALAAMQE